MPVASPPASLSSSLSTHNMTSPSVKSMEEGRAEPTRSIQYDYDEPKTMEGVVEEHTVTQRGLSSRQLQLLAIGGCIGTGLFVGTSTTLTMVGPAPLLMSYMVMSSIVWFVMNALGEMTTYLPISGVSVPYLIGRFTEPTIGFAAGYNYWYSFAMLLATEVSSISRPPVKRKWLT
ncbi:amino acid permease-domain-containing protein [Aspergillus varians]